MILTKIHLGFGEKKVSATPCVVVVAYLYDTFLEYAFAISF